MMSVMVMPGMIMLVVFRLAPGRILMPGFVEAARPHHVFRA